MQMADSIQMTYEQAQLKPIGLYNYKAIHQPLDHSWKC